MKAAILVFAILSTVSVAQLLGTVAANASVNIVTSNVYFCDNQACLYPSASANGSIQANSTFYMKLNVTNQLYAALFVRSTSVSFNTSASLSLVSASASVAIVTQPGYIIFNVIYPNVSASVVINVQGSLMSSRMLQGSSSSNGVNANSNSAAFVAAGTSSTKSSTGSNGQMIVASFLLAAILLL